MTDFRHLLLACAALALPALGSCNGGSSQPSGDAGPCPLPDQLYMGDTCMYPLSTSSPPATPTTCRSDITERCSKTAETAPNLSCLGKKPSLPPTPATVTLDGFVEVFSSGPNSDGITVSVYDAATLDAASSPDAASPLGTFTTHIAAADVGMAGALRACRTTSDNSLECDIPTQDCSPPCQDSLAGTQYCFNKVCLDNRIRYEARYSIPNIPTNKYLAIRTQGPGGTTDGTWGVLVQYNVFVSTADPTCPATGPKSACYDAGASTPTYELNINALSRQDYLNIPTSAGLAGGIPTGQGAIAGEVDDCNDVRVAGAQVGTSPLAEIFTYFNGNPANTLPIVSQTPKGTGILGLYAALGLPPGSVLVRAAGEVGGKTVDMGSFKARIWPDTVSVIGINGGHPPQ